MKKNKVGSIFLVSMLAMAGLGISYAGFSDIIYVSGTVNTGTVEFEIVDYSGSCLWKVWGEGAPPGEKYFWHGKWSEKPTDQDVIAEFAQNGNVEVELIAYAFAQQGATPKQVTMTFFNIFPCTEYFADVEVHYKGKIPAKVTIDNIVWDDVFENPNLWTITWYAEKGVLDGEQYVYTPIDFPVQVHDCNRINIEIGIHMLQPTFVNNYQGKTYSFSFYIEAIQWYDPCQTP